MNEAYQQDYLQKVLALDPRSMAEVILRQRREFLQLGDVFVAEFADDVGDDIDLRTRMLQRLNEVRREFWILDAKQLTLQLSCLQSVDHVETRTAAARLQQVAVHRDSIRTLLTEPNVHPSFAKALARILVASPAEANRLREAEHRWMRPEQNARFEVARRAVQGTAHFIQANYPGVFELEEAWLTELLDYDPREELVNESGNVLLGLLMLAGAGLTLFTVVGIVAWIFS